MMRLDIMHVRISLNLKSTKNNSLLAHQIPVYLPIKRLDSNGSSRFCLHHPSQHHTAALATVHHFCLRPISSISVRRQPPPRCRQMTPWAGYGHPRHRSFSVQNTGSGGIGTNAVLLHLSTLRLLSCIIRSSFRVTPDYLS